MKTHVIPWLSKEETERLLKEIYGRPVSISEIAPKAAPAACDIPTPEPTPTEDTDTTVLKMGSL